MKLDNKLLNTVHCMDCLEFMKGLPDKCIDLVLTDPPYGLGDTKTTKNNYESYDDDKYKTVELVSNVIAEGLRIADVVVMTPGIRNMFEYQKPTRVGSFSHPAGAGMSERGFVCRQPIFFYGKDPYLKNKLGSMPDSYTSTDSAEDFDHPCIKPLRMWRRLLNRVSLKGRTVLDCFAGSGTTGVACKELGRNYILVEKEPKYVDIINRRLANTTISLFHS